MFIVRDADAPTYLSKLQPLPRIANALSAHEVLGDLDRNLVAVILADARRLYD